LVDDLPRFLARRLSIKGWARSNVTGPGPDGGSTKSSPIGVALSGTPAIHPVLASGMKFATASLPARAGQLSAAAAMMPASRRCDLALVMGAIASPPTVICAATRSVESILSQTELPMSRI
jgi:hypothetical protein